MSFLRGALSESDGSPSFSRLASGALVLSSIGWVTSIVVRTHTLPSDLGGLSLFIGALYGINKVSTAVETLKKPPPADER